MDGISIETRENDDSREQMYSWLRDFNHEKNGPFMQALEDGAEVPFVLFAYREDKVPVGGITGITLLDWIKIDLMAVDPAYRGQGVGSLLMKKAEELGRDRGCCRAYVDTMSFQAPGFYKGLGYEEAGRLPNWDSQGHDKFFFTKDLT